MELKTLTTILTESEERDWSKYSQKELEFFAKFGVGPLYKPRPRPKYECGGCHKETAYKKTFHEDTAMEETALYCPECGWTERNV